MKRCGMVLTWFLFAMWVIVCLRQCKQSSAQPAVETALSLGSTLSASLSVIGRDELQ